MRLPGATRIDLNTLATLVLLPAVTGLVVGGTVAWSVPTAAAELGGFLFALSLVKLCYLGTAAAHLGRWIAEKTDGGPGSAGWWSGDADEYLSHHRAREQEGCDWAAFPNPLDGCALAIALTTLVHMLTR
ncbi:hypothetical protein HHL28_13910 [Aerophototrophica crusticola]|uniref:Uncharacterized protein n=1 Tax=Aerophototrophica crusticola TaxID=1709002 RepID=A0A858RA41_9PROT|nr:hypothetical protein HHL28_13910 [Rhodospirillaceae bacterium B3]